MAVVFLLNLLFIIRYLFCQNNHLRIYYFYYYFCSLWPEQPFYNSTELSIFCLTQTAPLLFLQKYPYSVWPEQSLYYFYYVTHISHPNFTFSTLSLLIATLPLLNRHSTLLLSLFCVLPNSQTSITWFSNICSCDSFHISSSTAAWYSAVFRGSSGLTGLMGALGDRTGEPMMGYWRKMVNINYSKYLAISPLIILGNLIVKFMTKS